MVLQGITLHDPFSMMYLISIIQTIISQNSLKTIHENSSGKYDLS